jgi:hypothetical protein
MHGAIRHRRTVLFECAGYDTLRLFSTDELNGDFRVHGHVLEVVDLDEPRENDFAAWSARCETVHVCVFTSVPLFGRCSNGSLYLSVPKCRKKRALRNAHPRVEVLKRRITDVVLA